MEALLGVPWKSRLHEERPWKRQGKIKTFPPKQGPEASGVTWTLP